MQTKTLFFFFPMFRISLKSCCPILLEPVQRFIFQPARAGAMNVVSRSVTPEPVPLLRTHEKEDFLGLWLLFFGRKSHCTDKFHQIRMPTQKEGQTVPGTECQVSPLSFFHHNPAHSLTLHLFIFQRDCQPCSIHRGSNFFFFFSLRLPLSLSSDSSPQALFRPKTEGA